MKTSLWLLTQLACIPLIVTLHSNRIVGGSIVTIEEYPYMASIRLNMNPHCGGAIISINTVLTAGHCCNGLTAATGQVVVGDTLAHTNGTTVGQLFGIVWSLPHPQYDEENLDNDIALVRIYGNFAYNAKVKPINLATANLPVGAMGIISGWGAIETRKLSITPPRPLKAATVPIISNSVCKQLFIGLDCTIEETVFCAGYTSGGVDACQGDSGGPLAYNGYVAGVVSWGAGCARPNLPGVYTKVSKYLPWIAQYL